MDEIDMVNVMSQLQGMMDKTLDEAGPEVSLAINLVILVDSLGKLAEVNPIVLNNKHYSNSVMAANSLFVMFTKEQVDQAVEIVNKTYEFAEDVRSKYGLGG